MDDPTMARWPIGGCVTPELSEETIALLRKDLPSYGPVKKFPTTKRYKFKPTIKGSPAELKRIEEAKRQLLVEEAEEAATGIKRQAIIGYYSPIPNFVADPDSRGLYLVDIYKIPPSGIPPPSFQMYLDTYQERRAAAVAALEAKAAAAAARRPQMKKKLMLRRKHEAAEATGTKVQAECVGSGLKRPCDDDSGTSEETDADFDFVVAGHSSLEIPSPKCGGLHDDPNPTTASVTEGQAECRGSGVKRPRDDLNPVAADDDSSATDFDFVVAGHSSLEIPSPKPHRHTNYVPPHQRPVDPTNPYHRHQPTPFSNHRQNHRPYTGNHNKNRPYSFNSYSLLSDDFRNQLNLKNVSNNLKQETHAGNENLKVVPNNLKQETHVEDGNENENSGVINFDAYEDIPVEVTGSDVPDPVKLFTEIDLGRVLNENIRVRCKYVKPTPIQRHAIPVVMGGRDLMACAQTGSGKTAAFCFPIISGVMKMGLGNGGGGFGRAACPLALVLSPTRELCCQIFEEARKFCHQTNVKVAVAYGGAPVYNQLRSFERGVDILVATPGRLTDMIERSKISLKKIKYLALDEADRMLDMGFEPQIRKIVEHMDMPPPGHRQTMLFSATFPSEIQRLASDFLSNYIFLSVGRVGSNTDLIQQKIVFVEEMDKKDHLRNLLQEQRANGNIGKNSLTLVFVETKRSADTLENWLCRSGFPATAIHGDKVQFERERALQQFKNGVTPILVATDVASRGLDIPSVAHVINFDLPRDIDSYVHRIGRTGRAGKSGIATAFFNDKNSSVAKGISELMKEAKQETPDWLAQYAESYSDSADYRRGSSKFGGRDFRSGNNNSNGKSDDYYSATNSYGNSDYGSSSGGYGNNNTSNGTSDYGASGGYGNNASYGTSDYGAPAGGYGNDTSYGNTDYGKTSDSYDYYAPPPAASDFSGSYGSADAGHGYESIVAGGWE